mgnify:CR=1 FL=1
MMELLAPAGGYEALTAAVQNGADAVYMGFGAFNARRGARNFTDEEFASAVRYCHLRGVRVFLTLNTLLTDRELPGAAKETLLVLDATTGQNGLIQARQFKETAGLTGIVLTKLDGTAKGGIVIAIAQELQVPVKYVGLGEGIKDLAPFDAKEFVGDLF